MRTAADAPMSGSGAGGDGGGGGATSPVEVAAARAGAGRWWTTRSRPYTARAPLPTKSGITLSMRATPRASDW